MVNLQWTLLNSTYLYSPALALNQVTGMDLWTSIISIGVFCIIYTSLGGIKAVVWADVIQCFVMLSVFLLVLIKSTIDIGGVDVVWERLQHSNKSDIFIWKSSPYSQYTSWTILFAKILYSMPNLTLHQSLMQRYLSNPTLKKAQISYVGGAFGSAFGQAIVLCGGAVLTAHYYDCDPLLSKKIKIRDQMMVLFSMETLSFVRGLRGVYVAGLMCATLSTFSSVLNSLATMFLSDLTTVFDLNLSDRKSIKLSRILVVIYGVAGIALVALIQNMGGLTKAAFSVSAITTGPAMMLFTTGMLLPWINAKGALAGFIGSMIIPTWAWIGNILTSPVLPHFPYATQGCSGNFTQTFNTITSKPNDSFTTYLYSLSSLWYNTWTFSSGIVITLIVSALTGFQDPSTVEPNLFFPIVRKWLLSKFHKETENITTDDKVNLPLINIPSNK